MKTTTKWLSLLVAVMMAVTLFAAPVSAASTVTRLWDDWESYADTSDILYYIGIQKRNKAVVAVNLDTKSVLGGKNSVKMDWDNNNTPGYATFWHEPDQDTRGLKNLVTTTDGFKITMAATGKVYVRLRLSFSWSDYQNDIFLKVDTTPRTYTVRWQDAWTADMRKQMEAAEEFSRLEMVIYNQENEGLTFNNTISGSLYFDDFLFFKGDDATDKMDNIGYLGVSTGKPAIGGSTATTTTAAKTPTTAAPNNKTTKANNNKVTAAPRTDGDNMTPATADDINNITDTDITDTDITEPVTEPTTETTGNGDVPVDDPVEEPTKHMSAWVIVAIVAVCAAAAAAVTFLVLKKKKQAVGAPDAGENPATDEENSPEE